MSVYKAEGIVLRRRALGEADRIITIFARNYGKIGVVAKGASKPKSRFGGRTELFLHGRYLLATGRNLDVMTQAEIINAFEVVRKDLYLTALAAYFVELVDLFTADREAHDNIFDLLLAALLMLEKGIKPDLAARTFELRLLAMLGYHPQLERCSRCGAMAGEAWRFDVAVGGVVCRGCGAPSAFTVPLSGDGLRLMRLLLVADMRQLIRADIPDRLLKEVERVVRAFMDYRSEGRIKSRDFLALARNNKEVD